MQSENFVKICNGHKTGSFEAHFVSQILLERHLHNICLCSVYAVQHGLFEKSESEQIITDILMILATKTSSLISHNISSLGKRCWDPLFEQTEAICVNDDITDNKTRCFRIIPALVKIFCHLQSTHQSPDEAIEMLDTSSEMLDSLFALSWSNHHLVPAMSEVLVEVHEFWSERYTRDIQVYIITL